MRCPAAIDRLSAFIDGELPDAERQAVEGHLQGCPACAAVHRRLANAWALAAEAPRVGPRVDLWPRVEARLAAGGPTPTWRVWPGWDPFPALATLALVAGLVLGLRMGDAVVGAGRRAASAVDVQARIDVQYLRDVLPGSLAEIVLEIASHPAGAGAPEVAR